MSMRDLISGEAELDDEENDESFDEETGEPRGKPKENGGLEDSSDDEEDDDDEEEAAKVRVYTFMPCLPSANCCLRSVMASS
jgi:transcription elongation factor SPT6